MVRYNTLAPASDCVLPTAFYFGTLVDSTCVDIVLAINDRSHYARTRACLGGVNASSLLSLSSITVDTHTRGSARRVNGPQ